MKPTGPFKTLALLFAAVLAFYLVAYYGLEHRRVRKGPWIVTFTNSPLAPIILRIDQPALALTNVQIAFPYASAPGNFAAKTVSFDRPKPVPFPLPTGECVFMDTTFLPGTVALRLAGHEVQLIPRVLTIDGEERPWRSGEIISITAIGTNNPGGIPAKR
ncbi:MAG TPA: hypothetical protein VK327_01150 [Candidatus Paceibacterota bacterium]|nr:hypothetical protein [Candidatus Paceibacterota bacterium]